MNTHKGLYCYQRLPFGVSSAPAIFQCTMETLLHGIPNVCVYLNDILVTGSSPAAHLKNLEHVFTRLEEAGVHFKKEKCEFMLEEVEYLGHKISRDGLQPIQSKVAAVANAPEPSRVAELRSFLGLVNYYGKFLPDLATAEAPLHNLLRKNTPWRWGRDQQSAFEKVKALLQLSDLLVHFDPKKEIILPIDASPFGVGQCSRTAWGTGLKDLSPMPCIHFRWLSASTRNWIRRLWPLFMESNSSISMCMGGHSPYFRKTSPSCTSSTRLSLFH